MLTMSKVPMLIATTKVLLILAMTCFQDQLYAQIPRVAWQQPVQGLGVDIAVDTEHNVYIVSMNCLMVKYDPDGSIVSLVPITECEQTNALTLDRSISPALTNVYITGRSVNDPATRTRYDILTVSYDSRGDFRWRDRQSLPICESILTKDEEGHDIEWTNLGFACVTGHGYCPGCSIESSHEGSSFDIVTLWYTSDGYLLREERFSHFRNGFEAGLAVYPGINAEYVTGMIFGNDCDNNEVTFYIPVLKYGHPGEPSWANLYGPAVGNQAFAAGYDIVADTHGNTYVAGRFYSNCAVLKYSNEGVLLWSFHYPWANFSEGRAICLDYEGNILVAGEADGAILIMKFTPNGTLLWEFRYGSQGRGANSIAVDILNNVYATGDLTIKVSSEGSLIWLAPCFSGGNAITISPQQSIYPAVYTTGEYTVKILQAPGDVDGDGCADDQDLLLILMHFGDTAFCSPYDLNGDGVVDDSDLLIVIMNFGQCWY